ncbi:endonuclease/exonuclease/phosphatase family protein [Nonomuraea soli]|uniref:Endonuclease/exonuclease/phosphatase family metal-dependent hydrolase n=1 Tax=Nonomuraea soli TaxID=1032476 RepID=A0A7W0CTN5_9ACTN|nr:endonuclease/exonuclease/phosphatase family protein [Nonomuraea soli]MBA2897152.1 endonuclease/exonuclease/phosphatase family metal-dependent hydrolase [Nonomuraea soli]
MTIDPAQPYGPLVHTTVRLVTWNVWGGFTAWPERFEALKRELARCEPDVIALQEWTDGGQAGELASRLGLGHVALAKGGDEEALACAVLSRWPVVARETYGLAGGRTPGTALLTEIDGPRGTLQVASTIIGSFHLAESAVRQQQVRQLVEQVTAATSRQHPTIVCGDFNAPPDSDEIRMLTGRAAPAVERVAFYDAWEVAGDGGPGHTWSNANPWAAPGLLPDRRFDYVFSAWPRAGGAGHPVRCEVIGARPPYPSDHFGVLAELRY